MIGVGLFRRVLTAGLFIVLAAPGAAFPSSRLDGAAKSIVFLLGPLERMPDGKEERTIGSGFLIIRDTDLFLVTAEHIARVLKPGALAAVRGADGKALAFDLQTLAGERSWRYHPTADLAALCVSPSEAARLGLHGRFLPAAMLRGDASAPSRSITLTVLGFPLALGIHGAFSPISRDTKPASDLLQTLRADTKRPTTFFVTQDPSVGGFSGAPVFDAGLPYSTAESAIQVDGRPIQIVGVAHGTVSDDTGGKLGLITPAHLLAEMIARHRCEQ